MSAIMVDRTSSERLIFVDVIENNNKFWHGDVEGNKLVLNWGRVGADGQHKTITFSSPDQAQREFEKRRDGKLRKGYTKQHTLGNTGVAHVAVVNKVQIDHSNDPETTKLIDFLVERNIHKIEGTTNIRLEAGQLTTPLGPVTEEGLDEAQRILLGLAKKGSDFPDLANKYLRIIPRDIGRKRIDPADLFGTMRQLEAEQATLDSLRAVVKDAEQRASQAKPAVFQTKLSILRASDAEFERLRRMFSMSVNRRHTSSGMQLYRAWEMRIEKMAQGFEERLGNRKELWHGTKDANLLSILKNGFIIPKRSDGITITGRMFGDGIYLSDQSTKALNYASGYWGGGRSQRCFMIFNDVAMGKEYHPRSSFQGTPPAGYDSTFVKAGTAGVMNNEMIVYRATQLNPTYLCEFR